MTLAFPLGANAEYLVPPGNSAATQYTEAYPTAGGPKNSDGQAGRHRNPGHVLGNRNAERLEALGRDGRSVAEVAALTAPEGTDDSAGEGSGPAGGGGGQGDGRQAAGGRGGASPDGSSGIGETLAAATGFSATKGTGPLLPIAIVATAIWMLAYAVRRRRAQAP